MRRILLISLTLLLVCSAVMGQQAQPQPQPLTFFYSYNIVPGKEEEFMNLIKTVGAPVRDKLMAEGVVLAWGMETPVLRSGASGLWEAALSPASVFVVDWLTKFVIRSCRS